MRQGIIPKPLFSDPNQDHMLRPRLCLNPGAHIREGLLGSGSWAHSPPRVDISGTTIFISFSSKASTWPIVSFLYLSYYSSPTSILIISCPVFQEHLIEPSEPADGTRDYCLIHFDFTSTFMKLIPSYCCDLFILTITKRQAENLFIFCYDLGNSVFLHLEKAKRLFLQTCSWGNYGIRLHDFPIS